MKLLILITNQFRIQFLHEYKKRNFSKLNFVKYKYQNNGFSDINLKKQPFTFILFKLSILTL